LLHLLPLEELTIHADGGGSNEYLFKNIFVSQKMVREKDFQLVSMKSRYYAVMHPFVPT